MTLVVDWSGSDMTAQHAQIAPAMDRGVLLTAYQHFTS